MSVLKKFGLPGRISSWVEAVRTPQLTTDLVDGDRARKVAFITGVTGQDGSYLVELLLAKGARANDATRRDATDDDDE